MFNVPEKVMYLEWRHRQREERLARAARQESEFFFLRLFPIRRRIVGEAAPVVTGYDRDRLAA